MTPEQIEIVERTLAAAEPHLDRVVEDFYERLFAADSEVAALFGTEPTEQRRRFAAELQTIATLIRRPDAFLSEVRDLGVRHATYGVRAAHYRIAGPALLEALRAALGSEWDAAVDDAWRLAYNLTVETMMAGAAGDV